MSDQSKFSAPNPLTLGKKLELVIHDVNGHGEGISEWEGITIFVKCAYKNEKCKVKISNIKRTFANAEKI